MAVTIDGTNGVTTPAESVTGTGVWSVGGSQIYKDALGNVGIGSTTPYARIASYVANSGSFQSAIGATNSTDSDFTVRIKNGISDINNSAGVLTFSTSNAERVRIDATGRMQINSISKYSATLSLGASGNSYNITSAQTGTGTLGHIVFETPNGAIGTIQTNGSTTFYNTSSDYRLKENIQPMTGALDKVALLKPCTYKWIVDGSDGQGFIAHELAEVEPGCVTGEKDAVDAEGKPQYQGIDTSHLVATLTAAIQEQQVIIQSLTTRITALEAK